MLIDIFSLISYLLVWLKNLALSFLKVGESCLVAIKFELSILFALYVNFIKYWFLYSRNITIDQINDSAVVNIY